MSTEFLCVNLELREYLDSQLLGYNYLFRHQPVRSLDVAIQVLTTAVTARFPGNVSRPYDTADRSCQTYEQILVDPQDTTIKSIVPLIAGRWAGHPFITVPYYVPAPLETVGDLADLIVTGYNEAWEDYKHLKDKLWHEEGLKYEAENWFDDHSENFELPCFFEVVRLCFADITPMTIHQLEAYSQGPAAAADIETRVRSMLAHKLTCQYRHGRKLQSGRFQYDLHWLGVAELVALLTGCTSQEELNNTKNWLRKQQLLPMHRDMLHAFRWSKTRGIVTRHDTLSNALQSYGYDIIGNYPPAPKLLPHPDYLEVALELEESETPWDADSEKMQALLRRNKTPGRQRIINLDPT